MGVGAVATVALGAAFWDDLFGGSEASPGAARARQRGYGALGRAGRERHPAARGLPARRVALGGETVPGSDYTLAPRLRRRRRLPDRRPRLDPRVQLRGAARRGRGDALRPRRRDPRRLPDPRRHHQQLRRRADAVGHVAVVRGVRRGPGVGVRPGRAEARRRVHDAMGVFKHEAAAVDPRGQARLPHRGHDRRRLLPLHARGAGPTCRRGCSSWRRSAAAARSSGCAVPDPLARREPTRRQVPGYTEFARAEGIWFDSGIVYVATTGDSRIHAYDTRARAGRGDLRRPGDARARRCCGWTTSPRRAAGELFVCEDISTEEIDIGRDHPRPQGVAVPLGDRPEARGLGAHRRGLRSVGQAGSTSPRSAPRQLAARSTRSRGRSVAGLVLEGDREPHAVGRHRRRSRSPRPGAAPRRRAGRARTCPRSPRRSSPPPPRTRCSTPITSVTR